MKLFGYLFLLLPLLLCSQEKKIDTSFVSAYQISYDYFKILTKQNNKLDSLGFDIKDGDTLIFTNKLPSNLNKGVKVQYEFKDSTFLKIYKNVVFNKINIPDTSNKNRMRYWKGEIKVFFEPNIDSLDKKEMKGFITLLSEVSDSLKIKIVDNLNDSNYHVYYLTYKQRKDYESKLITTKHGYYVNWKSYSTIYKASLKIDSVAIQDSKVRVTLLKWHFYASLGYFKLQPTFRCEDYLSSCFTANKKLSALDLEVLKYHYSYGICKGTTITEFQDQHKKAKEMLAINPKNSFYFLHPN